MMGAVQRGEGPGATQCVCGTSGRRARTGDHRTKSPLSLRSEVQGLARFGEVALSGQLRAESPGRDPTPADQGILF